MRIFRKSCLFGTGYHIFLFIFSLVCGYFVSVILDEAMRGNMQEALRSSLYFFALFIIGLSIIYFGRKNLGCILRMERQSFREKLYLDIIERRILVESTGEMDVRLSNDADTVSEYYQSAIPTAIEGTGIILGTTILLCNAHLILGFLLLGLSLLQFLPSFVYEKWAKEIYEQTDDAEENYDSWLIQGCDGITTLKTCGQEEWFVRKLEEISDGMVKVGYRAERTGAIETIVFQFVDGMLHYGSYIIIGLFVLYGGLKISDVPVLLVLGNFLFGSVEDLLQALQKRFEYQVASRHLKEVKLPERKCLSADRNLMGHEKEMPCLLEVSHLNKNFGNKNIFSDISFTVHRKERVLLCGANGSGKSTLLRVILGLLSADGGNIILDIENTAFALQEEANLTLTGNELAKDLEKEDVLKHKKFFEYLNGFGITKEIMEKPLSECSMGERKKFYLAAAFARDRELLILDEPTNHLDTAALNYLYQRISDYFGAVLAVSHQTDIPIKWQQIISIDSLSHQNEDMDWGNENGK